MPVFEFADSKIMDTNNDGKISFEEAFKAFLKSWILEEDSDADTNVSGRNSQTSAFL